MTGRRWRWAVVAAVGVLVLGGWLAARKPQQISKIHWARTADYLPGVAADVYLPPSAPTHPPVVLLVPGGGWVTADRRGLSALADSLAGDGMVVVNATYRAAGAGARFPVPVQDIVCAIDFAAAQARVAGYQPGPVVVVGHSAGAQLAALAALATDHFRTNCPYPASSVDGLVGLAGPYDVMDFQSLALPLFGATAAADPTDWRDGNPMTWLAAPGNRSLHVLLAHGTADDMVSSTATTNFGAALRAAGFPVTVTMVAGAGHGDIYRPAVIAQPIVTWIAGLRSSAQA